MARLYLWAPLALVAGCTLGGGLLGSRGEVAQESGASPADAAAVRDAEALEDYLTSMRILAEGDSVAQAETFAEIREAAERTPTTTNRLRLALALAVPGHPASDPVAAQHDLAELIATADTLLPAERALATIHLKDVEQRLILDAEAERLRRDADAARAREETDTARRLDEALAENRRLHAELEDALQKLDAITNIERSIRERGNGANTP
jgi:hypothetical protein